MDAFQRLRHAYFMWREQNQLSDTECISIQVTADFRASVLQNEQNLQGVWFQESQGRFPKERIFGCPFEVVDQNEIDGEYKFIRHDQQGGFCPAFLTEPYKGEDL